MMTLKCGAVHRTSSALLFQSYSVETFPAGI